MAIPSTSSPAPQRELLDAARAGDEQAFGALVEPHRRELHAHCYRMLGSVHDAEDALQNALLRAWRGLGQLEDPGALRAWLYKIATNACLDAIARRPKRVIPVDYGPAADPHDGPAQQPVVESVWMEPYPDERIGLEDGYAGPEARYEQREAVELAFVAALQHLPPNQRAALILREVLGFSANEAAAALDTTTASINSALQRARKLVDERLPEVTQQSTLRTLGDERLADDRSELHGRDGPRRRRCGRRDACRGCFLVDAAAGVVVQGAPCAGGVPGARPPLAPLPLAPDRDARQRAACGGGVHLARG